MDDKKGGCFGCFLVLLTIFGIAGGFWRFMNYYTGKTAIWVEEFPGIGFKAHYKDHRVEFCKSCVQLCDSDGCYGWACVKDKCVPFVPLPDSPDTGLTIEMEDTDVP